MASPQTHGIITLLLLVIINFFHKITGWEFISGIVFGVGIDFMDHFWNKKWSKDLIRRIKQGGGAPLESVGSTISWLHLWPGFLFVWGWGIIFTYILPQFCFYLPFVFWYSHWQIDRFQKQEEYDLHYHFLWPFVKKRFNYKWGYPIKPPIEFILNSALWTIIGFVLLGICFFR